MDIFVRGIELTLKKLNLKTIFLQSLICVCVVRVLLVEENITNAIRSFVRSFIHLELVSYVTLLQAPFPLKSRLI